MNVSTRWEGGARGLVLVDELLVDIAVKIQLSPTLHAQAVKHYEAINAHLDRDDSPLKDRVSLFYPQGSMAIGATIRSRDEDDLFDIDLVAEMDLPGATPAQMLDTLFEAVNGPRGSKYHGKVRRQTRCVTVDYEDMHLDITPLRRTAGWPERGGLIAHAHEDDGPEKHEWVPANPWGFAEWFKAQTPADDWFREIVLAKSLASDQLAVMEKAEAQPVPDHEHVFAKALAVVALQLTKRWARLNHDGRGATGRCIPSVALSRMFAENAGQTDRLVDELIHQASCFHELLTAANRNKTVIELRNPRLDDDCLTDRWPCDVATQTAFAEDLQEFIEILEATKRTTKVSELQTMLKRLFGEHTAAVVVEEFYKRGGDDVAKGRSEVLAGSGAALAGVAQRPDTGTKTSPSHRFFGD
jgi:hypothetical protein